MDIEIDIDTVADTAEKIQMASPSLGVEGLGGELRG